MLAPRSISRRVLQAFLVCAIGVLLLPVLVVYARALTTNETSDTSIFDAQRQATLLLRTLTIGAGAAALALAFGLAVGLAAHGMARFGRTVLAACCAVSILTPPYVFAVAWIDLWGPTGWLFRWSPVEMPTPGAVVYSVPGCASALAAAYYPIVAFAAYAGFRRLDPRWREAALIAGRSRAYFGRIALPILVRPIGASVLAVFLLSMYEFPVHSLLQVDTYLVEIHAAAEYHDYRAATLLSVPFVAAAILVLFLAGLLVRGEHPSDAGRTSRQEARRGAFAVAGWCVVLFAGVLPLTVVAARAMPPQTFVQLFQTAWQELLWSTMLAAVAAALIAVLATLSAVVFRQQRTLAAIAIIPFLISGPLLGLGLIGVYNRPGFPGFIYDSLGILLLAWTARFLFIGQWGIGAGVGGQPPGIHEASEVSGVSWWRTQLGVTIPLAMPYIAGAFGVAFILSFREVDTAVLVAPPGTALASVRLFTLMHYGPDGYVMAMALTMSAIAIAAGAVMYRIAAGWNRRTNARAE